MKTIPTLEATVLRMKTEIQADQAAGVVPRQVKSFSELHNYVDANEYGGFCEEGRDSLSEESVAFANEAQNQVDAWLRTNYVPVCFSDRVLDEAIASLLSADDLEVEVLKRKTGENETVRMQLLKLNGVQYLVQCKIGG